MISLSTKHLMGVKRGRLNTETCMAPVSQREVVLDGDKIIFMIGSVGWENRNVIILAICYIIWYHSFLEVILVF